MCYVTLGWMWYLCWKCQEKKTTDNFLPKWFWDSVFGSHYLVLSFFIRPTLMNIIVDSWPSLQIKSQHLTSAYKGSDIKWHFKSAALTSIDKLLLSLRPSIQVWDLLKNKEEYLRYEWLLINDPTKIKRMTKSNIS